ncbi:uncharacterized protein BP5553_05073 [Venustampulla echinocandica]|uniref:Uncharacterized protein n=1 Tax=Venustampulla echinocandica TaxID=2656787 RepID=A0A370TQ53_9HELO|nr:uncharacterized protein BP5553_05073 [Venustampulla echinocandica]RDL37640.1 hypothetical protein BP5553_05073 [Venustampulla echinocandica]
MATPRTGYTAQGGQGSVGSTSIFHEKRHSLKSYSVHRPRKAKLQGPYGNAVFAPVKSPGVVDKGQQHSSEGWKQDARRLTRVVDIDTSTAAPKHGWKPSLNRGPLGL